MTFDIKSKKSQMVKSGGRGGRCSKQIIFTHEGSGILSELSDVEFGSSRDVAKRDLGLHSSRLQFSQVRSRGLPLQSLEEFDSTLLSLQFDQRACRLPLKFPARDLNCTKKSRVQINAERSYVNVNAS
jgi:hypothetical protein